MNNVRREVLFSGLVQGVGFRYTVVGLAANLEVTGFVRNMPDGRVKLVAEGTSGEIDRLLDGIRDAMGGYIRDEETTEASVTGEFRGFGVQ
jgi:acylphosphatase